MGFRSPELGDIPNKCTLKAGLTPVDDHQSLSVSCQETQESHSRPLHAGKSSEFL